MNEPSGIKKIIQVVGGLALSRIMIVALVLTGIYYVAIYDSGETILKSIEASKIQLDVEVKRKIETQKVLKKEQQMKADVELFAKKFEEIKSRIPVEFSESELRSIVNQYSTRNGLKTIRTERRPPTSNASGGNANTTGENLVEQIVLLYEFEGSYLNIAKFATEISNLQKLIKIGDFSMNLAPNPAGSKVKNYDLSFKVSIIGYKQSLESLKTTAQKVSP